MTITRTKSMNGYNVGDLVVITKLGHYDETLETCKVNDIGAITAIDPIEEYFNYEVQFTNGKTIWLHKDTEFDRAINVLRGMLDSEKVD